MSETRNWIIVAKHTDDGERLYWNNAIGWVDLGSADFFSDDERQRLNLPIDGEWRCVESNARVSERKRNTR